MAEFNYERWWSLHLRAAKGDPLSEQEQIEYDLGQRLLDEQPEISDGDTLDRLRTLRTAIDRATSLHDELQRRLDLNDPFYHKIIEQGQLLYERQ